MAWHCLSFCSCFNHAPALHSRARRLLFRPTWCRVQLCRSFHKGHVRDTLDLLSHNILNGRMHYLTLKCSITWGNVPQICHGYAFDRLTLCAVCLTTIKGLWYTCLSLVLDASSRRIIVVTPFLGLSLRVLTRLSQELCSSVVPYNCWWQVLTQLPLPSLSHIYIYIYIIYYIYTLCIHTYLFKCIYRERAYKYADIHTCIDSTSGAGSGPGPC